MKLWLKPRWSHDYLELLVDDEGEFSIINGCSVDRRAPSILQNRDQNRISCVMLDTTWTFLGQYVTAILVAVSRNMAITLAVAFGHVEDFELYEQFWSVFQEHFGIDLSSFILVSDQGSGLRKFAREHHLTHRLCLRHFLATLKDRTFSVFVHYLVKVCTEEEVEIVLNVYREPLHRAITRDPSDGMRRVQSEFKRAGLSVRYPENEGLPRIETIYVDRWE
jgi:hypothetical protein